MSVRQLGSFVESIKSALRRKTKPKKTKKSSYSKMEKSSSVKVEIQSRRARKLIRQTLNVADRDKIIS